MAEMHETKDDIDETAERSSKAGDATNRAGEGDS